MGQTQVGLEGCQEEIEDYKVKTLEVDFMEIGGHPLPTQEAHGCAIYTVAVNLLTAT